GRRLTRMTKTLPLTIGQQGLWYLSSAADDVCAAYNVVMTLRTASPLDPGALERAMEHVALRHPLLAARVVVEDFVPRLVCDRARSFLDGPEGHAHLATAAEALVDLPAGDPWPVNAPHDARAAPPAGRCAMALPSELVRSVGTLAAREGNTAAAVYLSALLAL